MATSAFGVVVIWGLHWDLGSSLFGDIDLGSSPFGVIVIWGHHCDLGSSLCGDIRIWGRWDLGSSLRFGVIIGIWDHLSLGPSLGFGAISIWGH